MVDRYTKIVLTVIALSLAMLAVRPLVEPPVAFSGSGLSEEGLKELTKPPKPVEVPKAWGKFAGTFVSGLARLVTFEAADGTLRTTLACLRCDVVRK